MPRAIVCLFVFLTAAAQAQPDPMSAAIQRYWQARNDGRFSEAAARRQEARDLLERVPAAAPQFGFWAQQVAQFYQNAGMTAQASAVAEEALARAGRLGDAHPARLLLLNTLADFAQQDRNLLKAVGYLEKAAAAVETAPPAAAAAAGSQGSGALLVVFNGRLPTHMRMGPNNSYAYQRLADLYQQLGRPEAAAAVRAKMRALIQDDDAALAAFYANQGEIDQAIALYRKLADRPAADPLQATDPLQSLADLYWREGRYGEAVAALQQAIAIWEASDVSGAREQTVWQRLNLARMLAQSDQPQAADQVYRTLVAESAHSEEWSANQVLTSFANHLVTTKRSAEAIGILKEYLANHPDLAPVLESNVLFTLANAARNAGDAAQADEYHRAAMEKQRAALVVPPERVSIGSDLERADSAANGQKVDEAFSLALAALDAATGAFDREQVVWRVPSIVAALSRDKAHDQAEQLYQRLFAVVEGWAPDSPQLLATVAQSYAGMLMSQPDRRDAVAPAIQRFRDLLVAARGADSGMLEDALRMSIEFERSRGSRDAAILTAQELLAFEEVHNGKTSEPYLSAAETLAQVYESGGEPVRALPLFRETVAIADLVYRANDPRRVYTRMSAAFALARQRQFEEAERLATEGLAIGGSLRPPQAEHFAAQVEEIRRMKTAAQASAGVG
ncbi:MAG: tetratricopeptide repeat protein [Acidobacteriia bacterium]|nr:tetratricopeptide repeat protein [Terriglobia bacterium]